MAKSQLAQCPRYIPDRFKQESSSNNIIILGKKKTKLELKIKIKVAKKQCHRYSEQIVLFSMSVLLT